MVSALFKLAPKSKIQITNAFGYADGAGAQVQRILSLIAFSNKHKIDFVLNPICKVELQPIDNLTENKDLENNIEELNAWIQSNFDCKTSYFNDNVIGINNSFSLITVLLRVVFSKFRKNNNKVLGISLLDAYFETRICPEVWNLPIVNHSGVQRENPSERYVHIHFRLSTFSTQSDRNVPMSYYKKIMRELELEASEKKFNLYFVVHTDFRGTRTDKDLLIRNAVPQSLSYWVELGLLTKDYEINEGLISDAQKSLDSLLSDYTNVTFYNEKSWVSQWIAMSNADYLVVSKSSFSLIGGILNHSGIVYVPTSWSLNVPQWRNRS